MTLVMPSVFVSRFAQLQPGDLFLCSYEDNRFVALKAAAPDGDMLMVPIGPCFPDGFACPCLIGEVATTVISFGKDYALRLPTRPEGWRMTPPDPQTHCIAVTEEGVFLRATVVPPEAGFKPCYVAFETGTIVSAGSGRFPTYVAPRGPIAFAVEWELQTREAEPQRILAYP